MKVKELTNKELDSAQNVLEKVMYLTMVFLAMISVFIIKKEKKLNRKKEA